MMRELALRAMEGFARIQGFPLIYREEDQGDRVAFIGASPDGREYQVAYAKGAGTPASA